MSILCLFQCLLLTRSCQLTETDPQALTGPDAAATVGQHLHLRTTWDWQVSAVRNQAMDLGQKPTLDSNKRNSQQVYQKDHPNVDLEVGKKQTKDIDPQKSRLQKRVNKKNLHLPITNTGLTNKQPMNRDNLKSKNMTIVKEIHTWDPRKRENKVETKESISDEHHLDGESIISSSKMQSMPTKYSNPVGFYHLDPPLINPGSLSQDLDHWDPQKVENQEMMVASVQEDTGRCFCTIAIPFISNK